MYSMLELGPEDKLLEIGTGSATQTQAWAQSGCEIHTIELDPVTEPWRMEDSGANQVYAHIGDGKVGLPHEAPFTAIVATCGIESVPETWIDQLAEGGRILAPIGKSDVQRLTLMCKIKGSMQLQRIAAYVRFLMMR